MNCYFDVLLRSDSGQWGFMKVVGFNSGAQPLIKEIASLGHLLDPRNKIDFEGRELRGQAMSWKPYLAVGACAIQDHRQCDSEGT